MKRIFALFFACFLALGSLFGSANPGADSLAVAEPVARLTASIPLLLSSGMAVDVGGSRLSIHEMTDAWTGTGTLYFPALGEEFVVSFKQLEVSAFGSLLRGEIRARPQVQGEERGAMPAVGQTLPLTITSHLRSRLNYVLPLGSVMALTDLTVTDQGTFIGLDFDAPTLVEDDMLSFSGKRLKVDVETFCLDDADLAITSGGGFIDDFEFPMRILAGDPDEEDAGSYVTFDCDGFKEFNLSAEYPFPRAQVVPAANSRDTVFANFRIKATGLGDFVAFATVTPFEIVGIDDMVYTIDSAYVDYSDAENPKGFDLDPLTGNAPETSWKGLFLRRLQVTLPESVGVFNGGAEMIIGGKNIIYSRGNGMSGELYAYNLLDLRTGSLDGWGFSIDTLETLLVQNSVGDFNFRGDIFIPVFGEGDEIAYQAFLGEDAAGASALTIALEVAGTYTVPFLGDVEMTLTEDSRAGVRFSNTGPEPYLSASGQIDIRLGGEMAGVTVPEVNLPSIRFQDFKLNDLELAATQAANVATAGMDRMSFGTFEWGGLNLGSAINAVGGAIDAAAAAQAAANNPTGAVTGTSQSQEKKVNGKPVSIENIAFETVTIGGEELKRLKVQLILNLTKGSGGISGDLELGVRGKVDYAKLISLTPWDALSYHSLEVGDIEIEGRFGNVEFAGALSIYDADEVYGKGFKGGLAVAMDLGATRREFAAMGQFGTAPDGFNYFFVDFRTKFSPGITMGALEMTGIGGGLYFNMTKKASTKAPAFGERNPPVNNTPGESFSGTTYTPREGSIGLAAACTVGLAKKHDVFTSDAELTIEFGEESGIRKILFDLDGYFFLKDPEKKNEASLKANIAMELNFERGFLSAEFAYEIRAPYANPILVGGDINGAPQGSLLVDINPDDENEYSNHFFFGKPRRPADVALKIGSLRLGVDAYFMIGNNLPDPIPLREIHPALADFPDISRSQGNSIGFAFGVQFSTAGEVEAGPIKLEWDVVAGVDASIRKYSGVTCANTGSEIGMSGWYIKGRAYAYISAAVFLHVQIDLGLFEIDEVVELASLSVAASLVAELPNPTYVGGKVRVTGSALGFSVSKSVSVEVGEKCEMQGGEDPSAAVASIKVITGIYPEEESDEAAKFPIFANPVLAFDFPLSFDAAQPFDPIAVLEVESEDEDGNLTKRGFFPYLHSVTISKSGHNPELSPKWSNDHLSVTMSSEEVLEAEADYTLVARVRWRTRVGTGAWGDLLDNNGQNVDELKVVAVKTDVFPTTMDLAMLDPDRHFPGNGQRNWHRNFGPGEIYFSKSGMDAIFNTTVTKKVEGYGEKEINCTYEIKLTNLETEEVRRVPITERPGSFQLSELREKSYSYLAPTTGQAISVGYVKKELVSYSSRGIKFNGMNDEGILEKGKMYRFEILRVPVPDEGAQNTAIARQEEITNAGAEGVVVRSTSASITSQADPFSLPDVIYEFTFRTSKYDNLQQKIEQMRLVESAKGKPRQGIEHPVVERVNYLDVTGYPSVKGMPKVSDDYFVYRIDEGFDWWERQRLQVNMRMDESQVNYYETDQGSKLLKSIATINNLGGMPKVHYVASDPTFVEDNDDVWASIAFPRTSGDLIEPRLTPDEIEAGKANETVVYSTIANDLSYEGRGKWDLAVVHKGKRVLTFQATCAALLGRTLAINQPFSQYQYFFWTEDAYDRRYREFIYPGPNRNVHITPDPSLSPAVMNATKVDPYGGPDAIVNVGNGCVQNRALRLDGIRLVWTSWANWYRPNCWHSYFQYSWNIEAKLASEYRWPLITDVLTAYRNNPGKIPTTGPYTAPVKFYFQDTYSDLLQRVDGGQSVSRTLENIMN